MRLTLALLFLPALLAAQSPDSIPGSGRLPVSDSAARLPADRASDLVPWIAGGALDTDGTPTWRGTGVGLFDRESDGVRWASGIRSRGTMGRGSAPVLLEPELGGLRGAVLDVRGYGPATLHFTTLSGGKSWGARGSGETESPFRADGGMGFSRFEGAAGGPLGGGFRLHAAATLLGREALSGGIGYADDPYYLPTGIDTVMRYPDSASLPDSIDAQVLTFGPTTKVPYSARTTAGWTLRVDGQAAGMTLWARWIGARTSERLFSYVDVANPIQARGENTTGQDLAVGMTTSLGRSARLDAAISLQRERSEQGPITSQAHFDSSDPTLGLMLGGLDLRWSMENFAIDEELLANYRNNTPGSRRTPYDLENTAQYSLVDQYRNNPYGLLGWSESGGPLGTLAFSEDHRIVASAGVTLPAVATGALRLGAEFVRHDAKYYSHSLASQAYSDVWLEQPTEAALTADWSAAGAGWSARAGARLHRFQTGAVRPYLLDTASSSASYGRYQYFPRISSYGAGSDSLRHDVEDEAHTAFAPYAEVRGEIAEGWTGHADIARNARMPDLAYVFGGVNTDLAITNTSYAFGADLGHEITDHAAVGVTHRWGALALDATFFLDRFHQLTAARLVQLYDPARQSFNDIRLLHEAEGGKYQGVMVSGDWRPTAAIGVRGSYTFTDTAEAGGSTFTGGPSGVPRRHVVVLALTATGPQDGPLAGYAAVISYRGMSGMAEGIIPGYDPPYPTQTDEVPDWSSLDLRVARRFALAGLDLTAYLDGRNLFNAEDLRRVFFGDSPRSSPGTEALVWSNDSAAYASEATRSSAYDNGTILLTFGGAGRGGCGAWVTASGSPNPVNCAYLIAAEQRFGDGDGEFTLTEQQAASMSYYRTAVGHAALSGPPRAVRLGLQVGF